MQDKKKRFNNNNAEIRSAKMALDLLPWGPEKKNEVSNCYLTTRKKKQMALIK